MKIKHVIGALLLVFTISCSNSTKDNTAEKSVETNGNKSFALKMSDSSIIIRGNYSNGKKIGDWEFFDLEGRVKNVVSYDENSVNPKKIKYYNSLGKLIAIESYFSDEKPEMQYVLHHQNDSISNLITGKVLFQEYCVTCHGMKNKIVADPFVNIIGKLSVSEFENKKFKLNDSTHAQFIKLLSEEEVKDIKRFIYRESLK